MYTSIILPLFGLLSIYHTFCTLITLNSKEILSLSLYSTHNFFFQIVFKEQITPYNSQFNSRYLLFQYLYPLWQTYYLIELLSRIMLPSPFLLSSEQRQKRSLTQDVIP